MFDFKVIVTIDSLELTRHNAVTGEICFRKDEVSIPELHWDDFVVVVLNWWIEAINRIKTSNIGVPFTLAQYTNVMS